MGSGVPGQGEWVVAYLDRVGSGGVPGQGGEWWPT